MQTIKLSLNRAAFEFGVSKDTVARGLKAAGIETGSGKTYTIREVARAIGGDYKFARTREATLRGDLLALEKAQLEKRLVQPEVVTEEVNRAFSLVRQAILFGRAEIPPRANPQDHATARAAFDQWESRFFAYVRNGMDAAEPPAFPALDTPPPVETKQP